MNGDGRLRPRWSLSDIYGPEHVYCPRPSPRKSNWLPRDEVVMDNATGATLPVSGTMPLVCARGVATPSGLALMREAGFAPPPELHPCTGEAEHLRVLRDLAVGGRRLVMQYLHPAEDIPGEDYWVQPELLSYLNNKANLPELVPDWALPTRRLLATWRLPELQAEPMPFVLKAATDESSGGGLDVLICRDSPDLERAPGFFAAVDRVVVEGYLEIVRNLCLGFAVFPDGRTEYVGGAEQACSADGRFTGNWLLRDRPVPDAVVVAGRHAVEAAATLGYRGYAGIDVGVLESSQVRVFDLNFRMNNSSAILLLADSLWTHYPFAVARLAGWRCEKGFDVLVREAGKAMEKGDLLPLGTYDPRADGQEQPPFLRALLLGGSTEEVLEKERVLTERGLTR